MISKIHILQLGSPMGLYGAERWILSLAKYLDRERFELIVGTIKDEPDLEVPLCVESEKLNVKTFIVEAYGKANFSAVKKLRKYITQNKIDIVHTHFYKTDIIGLIATLGTSCKLVTTPHGWTKDADAKLKFFEMLDRATFLFFDAVVPLSKKMHEQLKKIPGLPKKLYYIQNGFDILEVDECTDIAPEIKNIKEKSSFIIGYIGRLVELKNLDVLLKSLARLEFSNWQLFLIGTGDQKEKLADLSENLNIREKVHFMGFREDRLSFLKGFDVFVLPSKTEGIPRCIMEAMAASIPVIASDIPGCRYLVKHEKTGLLFEPGNDNELRQMIEKTYYDRNIGKQLCDKAKDFVHKEFSATRMALEYEILYDQLTNNH